MPPDVNIKLTAEDQGVAAAIKELASQLKGLKTQQDETASSASKLAGAFQGLIGAIAVDKLISFGKEVFQSNVQIAKTAEVTGASARTLSVFHVAANDAGVSAESVDKAFTKLARSGLQLEEGNKQSAVAFKALNISAKDFAGLTTDQKIRLITDRLGGMAAGSTKAALAQQLLGRGGAEIIPVLDKLAGDGFDKTAAAAQRMGLILDDQSAPAFLEMQASLKQLEEAAEGATTQFEEGFVPALASVADGLVATVGGTGASAFKTIGEDAGLAVKYITAGFVFLGDSLGAIFADIVNEAEGTWAILKAGVTSVFQSAGLAAKGNFDGAVVALKTGMRDAQAAAKDTANATKAIWDQTAGDIQVKMDAIFSDAKRPAEKDANKAKTQAPVVGPIVDPSGVQKAQFAFPQKQLQDKLDLYRAHAKQVQQVEQDQFDQGLISLADYYDHRRSESQQESAKELAILEKGLKDAKDEVARAAVAKAKALTPADADKQEVARLAALGKVDELRTKIAENSIEAATKKQALDGEEFKARQENDQKVLEFEKKKSVLQGDALAAAKAEIAIEQEQLRIDLVKQGKSQQDINAQVASYGELHLAEAEFSDAQTKTQQDERAFELEKQRLQIQGKADRKSPVAIEQEINDLIRERLPLLQADAAAELGAARKTGNDDNVAKAQETVQGIQNIQASATSLSTTLGGTIATQFSSFFENLGHSTRSAADQFRGLASSIVQSMEQILAKALLLKIFGGLSGGGGFFGGLFGALGGAGHAEGGLIKGPGGPKADAIPARLSAGEYVVKADAVQAFGAHNLDAINRGLRIPSIASLSLPKFAEGGLVGASGAGDSNITLGIGLEEGLILRHLSSKAAGNIILNHLANNPKAASKALSRSS